MKWNESSWLFWKKNPNYSLSDRGETRKKIKTISSNKRKKGKDSLFCSLKVAPHKIEYKN